MIRRAVRIFLSFLLLLAVFPVSTSAAPVGYLAPTAPLSGDSLQENSSSTNNNGTHNLQVNEVPQPPIPTSTISHRRSQRDLLFDVSVFYYFVISKHHNV